MKLKLKQIKASQANKFITSDVNSDCKDTHDFNASALPFSFTSDNPSIDNVSDAINLIWSVLKVASPTSDEVITQELVINSEGIITSELEELPDDLSDVILIVNGLSYDSFGEDPAFTISGASITWNMESSEVDFTLEDTDEAVIQFTVKGEGVVASNYVGGEDNPLKYTEITPMTANVVEEVEHNLNSDDIIVNVWDLSNNTQISATIVIVDDNAINVTTSSDYDNIKVVVIK